MSQPSLRTVSESIRREQDRYIDLRVDLTAQDARGNLHPGSERILTVGGRWDRAIKRHAGNAERGKVLGLHPGQLEAARWITQWFAAKARGVEVREGGRPIFSALLHGGRRAGKTDLAAKAGVAYSVFRPGSFVWLISENIPKTEELEADVRKWLPFDWYEYRGSPWHQFILPNGSLIWLRSAHDPDALKRGRCDFAVLNEAQNMAERAFAVVRAATADNGGLTLLAANPPESPIGFWVERFFEETQAGKRPAREFHLDNTKNPHINWESLESMKDEVDERTFLREIKGVFLPREDVVFHAWKPSGADCNIRPVPDIGDVTREFTARHLHREFDVLLGMDFQRYPYACAVEMRAFRDPDGGQEPLLWWTDVTLVEPGDEETLSQALLDKGYNQERTGIIADASGAFQGIDRKRKVYSFDILKSLGWRHLYKPDQQMDKNPDIVQRCRAANALMKNASGRRRVFSAPELLSLNTALKFWELRRGVPYRKSEYAHLCDAATYLLWRFYPRRHTPKGDPARARDVITLAVGKRGPRML